MKRLLSPTLVFFIVFFIYFAVGTQFTFKPKWAIDYFNPMAQSLMNLRLDIQNPVQTYDLIAFKGKWYTPWGILTAIFLIPLQMIKGRFIPALYLSLLFSSLNTVVVLFLLKRLQKEFLPQLSNVSIYIILILFAFGTMQFYVGTLGSVWHVDQIVTSFFGILGTYIIFKKRRTTRDYFLSTLIFSVALIGRPTIALFSFMPIFLYIWENFVVAKSNYNQKMRSIKKAIIIFGLPVGLFSILFFLYNYLRFENISEYGYTYIHESAYLAKMRELHGAVSLTNVLNNIWYMLFEIPRLRIENGFTLDINLKGNSILFLTPPFLAAFLAYPISRINKKFVINQYIIVLWLTSVIVIFPSLMIYSTGWMQFGYRYSLDITLLILLLSIFGMRGKLNILYILGIIFAVWMQILGINSLM